MRDASTIARAGERPAKDGWAGAQHHGWLLADAHAVDFQATQNRTIRMVADYGWRELITPVPFIRPVYPRGFARRELAPRIHQTLAKASSYQIHPLVILKLPFLSD